MMCAVGSRSMGRAKSLRWRAHTMCPKPILRAAWRALFAREQWLDLKKLTINRKRVAERDRQVAHGNPSSLPPPIQQGNHNTKGLFTRPGSELERLTASISRPLYPSKR